MPTAAHAHCSKFTTYRILSLAVVLAFGIASLFLAGCSGVVSGSSSPNTTPPPGGTTPPTVSISAPANGATVSGTAIIVSATATDNVAVASVQFQLDGANLGAALTSAPYTYSWDSTKATNGSHKLQALAKDTSNNSATSAAVTVTVNNGTPDTTPPTVLMTAPANGATVSGTAVVVSANATDNVAVASVQFQLDGANLGALDTASPYLISWDTTKASNGSHSLRAIAKDTSNNSTTSAAVTVTVSNATDTTPPSVPTGLTATAVSSSQINLSWTASTDNVGVTGYKIFRAGAQIGTSPSTAYQDSGLTASTSYTYTVAAFDAAGNTSAQSAGASATTQASSGGGGIPSALGWYQIPNTTIQAVAPSAATYPEIQATEGPSAVVADWSGALADTKRSAMIVWGGGHGGYYGNELYSLNLTANPISLTRITTPSHGTAVTSVIPGCPEAYADGLPGARHTYNGLWYLPNQDTYYMAGAGLPSCGSFSNAIWSFDPTTLAWKNLNTPPGPTPAQNGSVPQQAYDSVTGKVYEVEANTGIFWSYSPTTNSWTNLANVTGCFDLNATTVIDPGRRLYFCIGNSGFWKVSLNSPYTITDIHTAAGCSALVSTSGPGFDFDPLQNALVGWAGGNTVYVYNPDTNSCTSQTYANGPSTPQGDGTYGRWKFFPGVGVFALVNAWDQNAWALRIDAAGGTGSNGPAISAVAVNTITTTGAIVTWTTDVVATTQVEYGTTTGNGTLTTLNSALVTSHSQAIAGLTAGTLYHYRVHSKNSAGTESISGDFTFATNSTTDTTPPTVAITVPTAGSTLSGSVTVTATASDNVGVASVQFLVDGNSLGTLDTTSPYQATWNTTTATNGAHTLSARALDAAGNVGNAVGVTVNVSNSGTNPALQDFQSRCAAPGVIVCEGFDSAAEFAPGVSPNTGLYSNSGSIEIVQDTTEYASGGGALKFPIKANAGTGSSVVDNNWLQTFCSAHPPSACTPQVFQENSDFYVQWRYRVDSAYVNTNWENCCNSSPKIADIAHHTSSCGQTELTTNNRNGTAMPMMYGGCGAYGMYVQTGTTLENQNTPYNFQSDYYNCEYPETPLSPGGCFTMPANTWMTFYEHIHIGTYNQPNSTVEAWVSTGVSDPLKYFIHITNFTMPAPDGGVITGYDAIWFNVYMTGVSSNSTNPAANVWLDEVIVSTQPIAAPVAPPAVP